MNARLSTAIAAAVIAASTTAPALAQPAPQAPIAISSCTVEAPVRLYTEGPIQGGQGGDLQIAFVNRGGAAATDVRFLVRIGRTQQTVDDRGSFASGVPIVQVFTPASASYDATDASCEVQSVSFADGTTWQR